MSANPGIAALTDRDSHYAFGANWARFAERVTDDHVAQAVAGLAKLLGDEIAGRSFLEIGCGSGIHALAALRLGAAPVVAFDIDPEAAATARRLLGERAAGHDWTVETRSLFDIAPGAAQYDIVYSWGVLHHTGALWRAVERSAALVRPGGRLAVAIYRRTPMCRFWRLEKRLYSRGPAWFRIVAETLWRGAFGLGLRLRGRNPARYFSHYGSARGMDFRTDMRDWLGGYPYESASAAEVTGALAALGFACERCFPCATRLGLIGVGCDEYVFRRQPTRTPADTAR